MSEKTPAQVLREAANLIRTRGHCKDRLRHTDGRLCLYGAIIDARGGTWDDEVDEIADLAGKGLVSDNLVEWNDAPERTADEVIAALEAAAVKAESTP